jgi:hypothetical protein
MSHGLNNLHNGRWTLHTEVRLHGQKSAFLSLFSVLFNDAINCKVYIASVTDEWLSRANWWNDTDSGKLQLSERNLCQCHCVCHKYHMDWPAIVTCHLLREAGD